MAIGLGEPWLCSMWLHTRAEWKAVGGFPVPNPSRSVLPRCLTTSKESLWG